MKLRVLLSAIIILLSGCFFATATRSPAASVSHHPKDHERNKHTYRYYPDLEIYGDMEENNYVVFKDNAWTVLTVKPPILTPAYSYVVIEDDGSPWLKHAFYRDKYPPIYYKPGKVKNRKE